MRTKREPMHPKQSFSESLAQSWNEDKPGFFFTAILVVLTGAVVILGLIMVVSPFVRMAGIHEGSVIRKVHVPESTSLQCSGDKMTTCVPTVYPESWDVSITKDGHSNTFSIPESKWNSISKGDYLTFDGDTLTSVNIQ